MDLLIAGQMQTWIHLFFFQRPKKKKGLLLEILPAFIFEKKFQLHSRSLNEQIFIGKDVSAKYGQKVGPTVSCHDFTY